MNKEKTETIYKPDTIGTSIPLRTMATSEHNYVFKQSQQINAQCGFIGYLRGDFGRTGYQFYTTWFEGNNELNTPEFSKELDEVINDMKDDPKYRGILHNLEDMILLCSARPNSHIDGVTDTRNYGFRADTKDYSYLIRCVPYENDYNFYVFCYKRNELNRHILKAEKGIRFITPNYAPMFTLKDGGCIRITYSNGEKHIKKCRYIDEYHTEIGDNIFHICEFAELMQKNGNKVEPLSPDDLLQNKKPKSYER